MKKTFEILEWGSAIQFKIRILSFALKSDDFKAEWLGYGFYLL